MENSIVLVLSLIFSASALAEDAILARLFEKHTIEGTLIVSSLADDQTFIHNDSRAERRFAPASTFKVMNTLIAVEEKAAKGKDEGFKWDGKAYPIAGWNHDQTLESAFKVSCVWCYQELARRIGADRYRSYLKRTGYGELEAPFELTTFWLDGPLKISPLEQIEFLKKLHRRSLPFSAHSYETLREIMLVEKTSTYSLWAKTGWGARAKPQVGWYIGYVETAKGAWVFALNIELRSDKDLPLRQPLVLEALRAKGII